MSWIFQPTASPSASAQGPGSPDDRGTSFRPVDGGPLQSGERLLVEAYAAIWLILFGMLLLSWRRQRQIDARVARLEREVAGARDLRDAAAGAKRDGA